MEDIYKLIDDINLQNRKLRFSVNEALSSNNDDALFILGELYIISVLHLKG